jgi:hypothetical protein
LLCGLGYVGISYVLFYTAFSYRPPVRPNELRHLETCFLRPSFAVTRSGPLGICTVNQVVHRFLRFLASRSRFPVRLLILLGGYLICLLVSCKPHNAGAERRGYNVCQKSIRLPPVRSSPLLCGLCQMWEWDRYNLLTTLQSNCQVLAQVPPAWQQHINCKAHMWQYCAKTTEKLRIWQKRRG